MIYKCQHCKQFLMNYKSKTKIKINKCRSVEFLDGNTLKIKCSCNTDNIIKIKKESF